MRQAADTWITGFDHVPASVIEKMAKADEAMTYYDSDSLRLIASPTIECGSCNDHYNGELTLEQLRVSTPVENRRNLTASRSASRRQAPPETWSW